VEDGDIITIDIEKKTINLKLTDEEIAERLKKAKKPDHPAKGVLAAYRRMAEGADEGAVWLCGQDE
jgi:dihydroxy-acid dehydratase